MKATVSSEARHRKLLTPIPPPPARAAAAAVVGRRRAAERQAAGAEDRFRLLVGGLVDADPAVGLGPLRRIGGLARPQDRATARRRRGTGRRSPASAAPRRRFGTASNQLAMFHRSSSSAQEGRIYSRPRGASNIGRIGAFLRCVTGLSEVRRGLAASPRASSPVRRWPWRRGDEAAGCRSMGKIVWLASFPKSGQHLAAGLSAQSAGRSQGGVRHQRARHLLRQRLAGPMVPAARSRGRRPRCRWRRSRRCGRASTGCSPSSASRRSSSRPTWPWSSSAGRR